MRSIPAANFPTGEIFLRIREEVSRLLQFIRRPRRRHPVQLGAAALSGRLLILYGVNLLITCGIALPLQLALEKLVGLRDVGDSTTLSFFFSAVLIAPVLEEAIFRAGLRSATVSLAIQPILISLLLNQWQVALALTVIVVAGLLVDRYRQRDLGAAQRFALTMARGRAFLRRYHYMVWGYALAFGLSHIFNFAVDAGSGWLALLIVFAVVSQAFGGLLLSYLRLRYGLLSAMAFHGAFNLAAFGIARLVN